ncbi:MAG: IS3 family transposase [Chthoniobacter sp.]|uniref:IS3 family transposase n=1 Tax=Chthoniobacter sp. TaxID=2510640 RepID=UPI0032A6C0DB
MKRKRHTPEEIIKKLREAATLLAAGQSVEEVCKKLEVSPPTYHRWRQEYGGAKEETVKRLKELEKENGRLKKLVADLSLDKAILKEIAGGKMVGPARKREAVQHVEQVLNVSERRACGVTAQPRATQRYRGRRRDKDARLIAELRRISAAHPRAGYRRATALLRRAGLEINAKRVQRLWRQEGLKVPRRQRKRQRLGNSAAGTQQLRAERVNQVWSYDFVFDQTEDGRRLKWLPICDEFSRELVALEVERRMEAKDVIRILDAAVVARGCVPEFIRSDNGPEFVALAVQEWIARRGFQTLYIKPGSPWQNAYSESFNSRFRDEFLNREAFASVLEAKVLGKEHRQRHNRERPHSSLNYQTPEEFAQRSLAAASATLRQPPDCAPSCEN